MYIRPKGSKTDRFDRTIVSLYSWNRRVLKTSYEHDENCSQLKSKSLYHIHSLKWVIVFPMLNSHVLQCGLGGCWSGLLVKIVKGYDVKLSVIVTVK